MMPTSTYQGCDCDTCKELNVDCPDCPVCYKEEEMDSEVAMAMYDSSIGKSEDYYSDDEDMDKWSNIEKKCWVGYTQRGMKDKGGRMVPNCVPVGKLDDSENEMAKAKPNYEDVIKDSYKNTLNIFK